MPTVGRGASTSSRGFCPTRGRDLTGRKVFASQVEAARLEAEAAQRLEAARLEAERLEAEAAQRLEAEAAQRLEAERLVSSQDGNVLTYMNRTRTPLRVFPSVHESQSASGMCGPPPGYIHHDPRFNYQPGRVFADNIHLPDQPVNSVILERANEIDRCNQLKMGRVDGGRKKKSRQKKQHHRRNRRHSTRKHKK